MQLALAEQDMHSLERSRQQVVEMAMLLEEKAAVPAVRAQLGYLAALQESEFWEGMSLARLEDLRLRLRSLAPFIDRKKRTIVYTDFQDSVLAVREQEAVYMPKMTGVQYEKKVRDYLRSHQDQAAIGRLRANRPPWWRSARTTARRSWPTCSPAAVRRRSRGSCAAWWGWTAAPRRRRFPGFSTIAA
jgi:type I restriction enzyme R subunit